jgi:hypothetical protein
LLGLVELLQRSVYLSEMTAHWIIFTAAWAGIIGYFIGGALERRSNSERQQKLETETPTHDPRETERSYREAIPISSAARDSFESGRLIGRVDGISSELGRLASRVKRLESERDAGAA